MACTDNLRFARCHGSYRRAFGNFRIIVFHGHVGQRHIARVGHDDFVFNIFTHFVPSFADCPLGHGQFGFLRHFHDGRIIRLVRCGWVVRRHIGYWRTVRIVTFHFCLVDYLSGIDVRLVHLMACDDRRFVIRVQGSDRRAGYDFRIAIFHGDVGHGDITRVAHNDFVFDVVTYRVRPFVGSLFGETQCWFGRNIDDGRCARIVGRIKRLGRVIWITRNRSFRRNRRIRITRRSARNRGHVFYTTLVDIGKGQRIRSCIRSRLTRHQGTFITIFR